MQPQPWSVLAVTHSTCCVCTLSCVVVALTGVLRVALCNNCLVLGAVGDFAWTHTWCPLQHCSDLCVHTRCCKRTPLWCPGIFEISLSRSVFVAILYA